MATAFQDIIRQKFVDLMKSYEGIDLTESHLFDIYYSAFCQGSQEEYRAHLAERIGWQQMIDLMKAGARVVVDKEVIGREVYQAPLNELFAPVKTETQKAVFVDINTLEAKS